MDIRGFEKLLMQLEGDIKEAQRNGKTQISSIISPDVLIFDVGLIKNPATKDTKWDDLTIRQQIEIAFAGFPNYLMRDRIYVPPQYLNMHIYAIELGLEGFEKGLKRTKRVRGVKKVHPNQDFLGRSHDLFQGVTRSAHYVDRIPNVLPGERVFINAPIQLTSGCWFFIKLMTNDKRIEAHLCPHLAFTFEPRECSAMFEIAVRLAKCFA